MTNAETVLYTNRGFGWTGVVGGALMAFGAFLPWMTMSAPFVGTISRSGMDGGGDGMVALLLGASILAVSIPRVVGFVPGWLQFCVVFPGAVGVILGVYDYVEVTDRIAKAMTSPMLLGSVGVGLPMILLGSAMTVLSGVVVSQRVE